MIEEVMRSLNNYFPTEYETRTDWEIANGQITVDFLKESQLYVIQGSTFNDGVYRYGDSLPHDEVFSGTVTALAPPPAFLKLVDEISEWQEEHGTPNGGFTSESFGGYSYSKSAKTNGSQLTWQDAFGARLRQWRRI